MPDPYDRELYDLAIVGAGPTGLYAAFYAGLRDLRVLLLDSLPVLGGQLSTLYPEKYIYDVAGFPKVLAKTLAAQLIEQALQYRPTVRLNQQISTLTDADDGGVFTLSSSETEYRTRSVLVAAGIGAFRPRPLPLAGVESLVGRGLHYQVDDPQRFAGRRVLVVGGGDSAVDWANALTPIARSVTVVHRRDQFRAHEHAVRDLRASPAQVMTPYELESLAGEFHVEHAVLRHATTNELTPLPVDEVLVSIGFDATLGAISGWGLALRRSKILVDTGMRTSRPGVLAAGDVTAYDGKLALISVGFGEAAIAVNHAKLYLDPTARLFPGHSSERAGG